MAKVIVVRPGMMPDDELDGDAFFVTASGALVVSRMEQQTNERGKTWGRRESFKAYAPGMWIRAEVK